MSERTGKTEIRAERIYTHLKQNLNTPFQKHELLSELGLSDSKTTRIAIRKARDRAIEDGLYLTVPVYENGYTLAITDDPSAAVDPALWLSRVEHGVAIPRRVADEFMRSRMSQLAPVDRAYVNLRDKVTDATQQMLDALDEVVKAQLEARREARREREAAE